jgi:carboxyl-terminal processing protease
MQRTGAPKSWDGRLRKALRASLVWSGAAVIGFGVAATIAGCTAQESSVARVMEALGVDRFALSEDTRRQLDRFSTVYDRYASTSEADDRLDYFRFAFRRVRTSYVREVSDAELIDAAIKGVEKDHPEPASLAPRELVERALDSMLQSLDPHSDYMNAREFEETYITTRGEFGGLGIEVTMDEGLVKIVSPIEDTPAERAGLKPGDRITAVDGEPVKGKSLSDAVSKMRGEPGTEIVLRVLRGDKPEFDVTIVRAVIKVRSVRWRVDGDIGYVRVTRFSEKVETGIAKAMAELRTRPQGQISGIVLDLRSNPGGLLDQSLILADSFLDKGGIVSVRGRTSENQRSYDARPGDLARNLPIVVLINGGSASASEIVASALQFHHRATVMGTRSFGKGSVQTIMPLPVEGALRLTTALYYSPSGRTIQAEGVHPDIVIQPEDTDKKASQRERDLPGALPGENEEEADGKPRIPEDSCPEVGERKDRVLGCAYSFLKAGSTEGFLAEMAARGKRSS